MTVEERPPHQRGLRVLRGLVVAALAVALAVACSGASTAPRLGDDQLVRYGKSVRMPGDTVQVQFAAVTTDSRCPSGAQCIWAGEAAVLFTVGGSEQVALSPQPSVNASLAKTDYVATIRFTSAND